MIDAAIFDRCVSCGLCLPACPTYQETMTETLGPRGRISLIKAMALGELEPDSPGFQATIGGCLGCRACEAACPSGVAYGELLEQARERIEHAVVPSRSLPKRMIRTLLLRDIFAHPWMLRASAAIARFGQRLGLDRLLVLTGVARLLGLERAIALAPRFDGTSFVAKGQRFAAHRVSKTVALHVGCIASVAFAKLHEATIRVLNHAHCTVVVPAGQGCCGAIAAHAGERTDARERAKAVIAAFESSGASIYVTNVAGCGAALKEYGTWFAHDAEWSERARTFSAAVRDITELLDEQFAASPPKLGPLKCSVAYQDPCHLAHAQRNTAAPRRLLELIPAMTLVPLRESSLCCGGAGVYNLTQPDMSDRLRARKIETIIESGAQVLATANPGCAIQIEAGLRERTLRLPVMHVVELLDEAFSAYDASTRSRPASASAMVR